MYWVVYDTNPEKLQCLIDSTNLCIGNIEDTYTIRGTEVIPVPLFHALNGKNSDHYISRDKASSQGGKANGGLSLGYN